MYADALIVSAHPQFMTDAKLGRNGAMTLIMSRGVGLVALLPVSVIPILQGDWVGLANAAALQLAIITRALAVHLNREAIYHSVAQGLRASERAREMVKVAITLPKGKLVTMYCQREIVKQTISTAPRPDAWKYKTILGVSWIALGCHLVSIGMASLLDQICCVVVLVVLTIALCG